MNDLYQRVPMTHEKIARLITFDVKVFNRVVQAIRIRTDIIMLLA